MPELQKVGEYSYLYGLAEKREQPLARNKNSIGDRLTKGISSSVLRNMGNMERKKIGKDFDQVALISDNDDDDDDDLMGDYSRPVKKTKIKKKTKNKLTKRISDPTSNSSNLSRNEAELLDGFQPPGANSTQLDLMDPKESVLQNLKKKHGIFNTTANKKTNRFNDLDDSQPQTVRGIKSSLSRARILQNSKIDEAKVSNL